MKGSLLRKSRAGCPAAPPHSAAAYPGSGAQLLPRLLPLRLPLRCCLPRPPRWTAAVEAKGQSLSHHTLGRHAASVIGRGAESCLRRGRGGGGTAAQAAAGRVAAAQQRPAEPGGQRRGLLHMDSLVSCYGGQTSGMSVPRVLGGAASQLSARCPLLQLMQVNLSGWQRKGSLTAVAAPAHCVPTVLRSPKPSGLRCPRWNAGRHTLWPLQGPRTPDHFWALAPSALLPR